MLIPLTAASQRSSRRGFRRDVEIMDVLMAVEKEEKELIIETETAVSMDSLKSRSRQLIETACHGSNTRAQVKKPQRGGS